MTKVSAPRVRFDSGVYVVELGEDYSHLQESVLKELNLLPQLAESIEPACLLIDMANVKFIGSAVIGMFVNVSKSLNERGGAFGLLHANQFCQTVIGMAQLSSFLPSYDSIDDTNCTPTPGA